MVWIEISCLEVRSELSNYLEEDVTPALRVRIEAHVNNCGGCRALYDGVRNIIRLTTAEGVLELPEGFSQRLYRRITRATMQ